MLKEYGYKIYRTRPNSRVLILILMEHAQRGTRRFRFGWMVWSLNPYFNGTCSKSSSSSLKQRNLLSLNPYFNGTCSKSWWTCVTITSFRGSLNPYFNGTCSKRCRGQSIELSQDGLNPYFNGTCSKRNTIYSIRYFNISLNPYFNGTCSKRAFFVRPYVLICYVVKFTLINVFVLIKCTCFMQKIVQR